jgi:hypothetical protein
VKYYMSVVLVIVLLLLIAACGPAEVKEWRATYCAESTCPPDLREIEEYEIFDANEMGVSCPATYEVEVAVMPVGKSFIPIYRTYYLKPGTCVVRALP